MHVQCDTLHTCLFSLLFVSCPHRIALITSVLLRQLAWRVCRKISASNAYTCTILLCCHTLYSILILMCTNIAIAFTCSSEKFLEKLKLLTRYLYTLTWCGYGSSSLKVKCSEEGGFYFSILVPFSSNKSEGFLHYQFASPWKLYFNA